MTGNLQKSECKVTGKLQKSKCKATGKLQKSDRKVTGKLQNGMGLCSNDMKLLAEDISQIKIGHHREIIQHGSKDEKLKC